MTRARWVTVDTAGGFPTCRILSVPPAFLSIIGGALQDTTDPDNWEQAGTLTPEQCAAICQGIVDDYYESDCLPAGATMNINQIYPLPIKTFSGAGAFDLVVSASAVTCSYVRMTSPAQFNSVEWRIFLAEGTYVCEVMYGRRNSAGQGTMLIDGVSFGTAEFYGGSLTFNNRIALGGMVVVGDGEHTLRMEVNAKIGASSNYDALMQMISIYPA